MFKNSKTLLKRAKELIPGGCSTESKKVEALFASEQAPAFFKGASGAKIIDVDGNEFIDFGMALGACILGYNHPVIVEAVEKELRDGFISILPSALEVELD